MIKIKYAIKLCLPALILILFFGSSYAAEPKDEPQLGRDNAKELEKLLNDHTQRLRQEIEQSYYSVPKKEFEKVTVQNITQEVSTNMIEKFNFWRNIVLFIITLLSFIGIWQIGSFRKEIKEYIGDKVDLLKAENKSSIKDDINSEMVKILKYQEEELSKLTSKITKEIDPIKDEVKSLKKLALRTELDRITLAERSRLSPYPELIRRIEPLFSNAIEIKDTEIINDYLDEVFRLKFLDGKYEQLDKLRMQYEKDYEFKESTWANIAIADMYLYEENNSAIYKERALSAYKNALEGVPDYGTAHAVRLIMHMIDHERQKDPDSKEKEKKEALALINNINSGSRFTTSYETYDYFLRTPESASVVKYIDMLYMNFPEAMKNMEERYNRQLELLNKQKQ